VLHVILYIPLLSYSGVGVCFFCFMHCCVVVVVLNAMFIFVFLNRVVIVLIFGL